jgi:hypothetical protein
MHSTRTIKVFLRLIEAIDLEVEITEIGFDVRDVWPMLRSLKVITGSGIGNQSAVNVITVRARLGEIHQSIREHDVISAS